MSEFLFLDIESRSAVDLRKTGAHVYFESDTTDVWLACYAFDDEEVQTWWPGEPCPPRIAEHIRAGGMVSGWNVAGFEMLGWNALLGPKYGWPIPRVEQYDDTAAMAAAMALPRDLAGASAALGLPVQKDMEGRSVMLRMAKPRKPRRGEPDGLYWHDADKESLQRLAAYCKIDVETERLARRRLVPLSELERRIWLLDAKINNRGVLLDLPLVRAMKQIVEQAQTRLDREMTLATGGYVTAATQVGALTNWLQDNYVPAESLAKSSIKELLNLEDLPTNCRKALELRQEGAKSSTAKLEAAEQVACKDGRARGMLLYHGTSTGRWAGKLLQLQNFPRGTGVIKDPEKAVPDMMRGDAEWVSFLYGPPLSAVSDCLRSIIRAAPGHDLISADFSAIEGRVTAWLAEEQWDLDAYRANDEGRGPGLYEIAAADIFNVPVATITKKDPRRQVGKVAVLALGFAGSVRTFYSMAKNYPDVDMAAAYGPLKDAVASDTFEKAAERYAECLARKDQGADQMPREAWIASELTKVMWRAKHPKTVALWKALEVAAFEAVENPGHVRVVNGKVAFLVRMGFLWCRLPSGRCLAYASPKIGDVEVPWADKTKPPSEREKRKAVTALGVNSVTRRFERYTMYSGLYTENCVQAIARDIMANAMLKAEDAGYPIVMTVHDELVAEVRKDFGTVKEFERLICDLPMWAAGLPLTSGGYRAERFKKD